MGLHSKTIYNTINKFEEQINNITLIELSKDGKLLDKLYSLRSKIDDFITLVNPRTRNKLLPFEIKIGDRRLKQL